MTKENIIFCLAIAMCILGLVMILKIASDTRSAVIECAVGGMEYHIRSGDVIYCKGTNGVERLTSGNGLDGVERIAGE